MQSVPCGSHVIDSASVYTRAACQLEFRPSHPFARRLCVRAFHSFNGLRGNFGSKILTVAFRYHDNKFD